MGRLTWSLLLLTLALAVSLAWWLGAGAHGEDDAPPGALERGASTSASADAPLPATPARDARSDARELAATPEPVALTTPGAAPSADEVAEAPTVRVTLRALADFAPRALSVHAGWVEDGGWRLVDEQEFALPGDGGVLDVRRSTESSDATWLELRVAAPELQTVVGWVQLPDDVHAFEAEFDLPAGVLWHGRVVDVAGAPVVGADVTLFPVRAKEQAARLRVGPAGLVAAGAALADVQFLRDAPRVAHTRSHPLWRELATRESDANGLVALGPVRPGVTTLSVRHREYLQHYDPALSIDAASAGAPYTIVLERGATLRGTLVDADGAPVVSTNVTITRLFDSALLAKGVATSPTTHAMADWDGAFESTGLEPGRYELRVAPQGFEVHAEEFVVPTGEPVQLVLGARCERRVVFAGELIPDPRKQVTLRSVAREEQRGRRNDRERALTVTPPDELNPQPVLLLPNDLGDDEHHALIPRGAIPVVLGPIACGETLTLTARPEGTLRGRVLDAHGDGIPDVEVRIDRGTFSAQPELAPFLRPQGTFSDAEGRWSLPHWGPGEVKLAYRAEGWLGSKRAVELTTFGEQSAGDDTLERARRVIVDVRTPDGEPAPALRVALGFESLAPLTGEPTGELSNLMISGTEAVTDLHGRVVFEGLPAGRGWVGLLRARPEGDPRARRGPTVASPGDHFPYVRTDATDEQRREQVRAWADALGALAAPFETGDASETQLTLVALPRPVLRGSVSGLGALLESAQVALIQPSGVASPTCLVLETLSLDARGEFTSPPLDPRPTLLVLQAPWLGPLVVRFLEPRLGSDEHVHLKVVGQTLRVRVVDAGSGEPVPDAEMSFARMGAGGELGGDALAWGLPPGTATELFECVRAPPGRLGFTRADGGFEIPGLRALEPGQVYGVGVRVRGWQPHWVQLGPDDWPDDGFLELRLARAGRLHVTVLTQEGDTEIFEVEIADANSSDQPLVMQRRGGTFQLDDLAPGSYALVLRRRPDADPPGEVLDRAQVVLTPSAEPVQIELDAR